MASSDGLSSDKEDSDDEGSSSGGVEDEEVDDDKKSNNGSAGEGNGDENGDYSDMDISEDEQLYFTAEETLLKAAIVVPPTASWYGKRKPHL
ncbi:hypothetical protein VNI00_013437 [Paramarasmius palmivorus]|uniref:Uncharacterized protein n=1 Tax=Paramarasmius palmivorus TaxID=297713 RepID=A0AAW0C0Z5_9AGAR